MSWYSAAMSRFAALMLVVLVQVHGLTSGPEKHPTPPLEFATEYARELISLEEVRARGAADLKNAAEVNEKLTSGIHFSTLIQLELRSQVRMLRSMRLTGQFATLIPSLINFDEQKIDLHQQMINLVTKLLGGPKPGEDYGQLAAQMPKIRAELEDLDHTLFANVTPLVCMTLVDMRPDSRNHVSHLLMTKAEKADLIEKLVTGFGKALDKDQDQKNFTVSAGLVMKGFLQDHASADDPWQ